MHPVLQSRGRRREENGADQENGMLDHCPGKSLVNTQVFKYNVLFNAHAGRGDDLAQAFVGAAALWCGVRALTH